MAKDTQQTATIEDVECTAQELIHMALAFCEKRINVAQKQDAAGYAMASAVMCLVHAIQAFISIEHIQGK